MFIDRGGSKSDETVLMSLTGNFDLNEISILTDKMRIPWWRRFEKSNQGKIKMKTIYSFAIFLSLLVVGCTTRTYTAEILWKIRKIKTSLY
jgi:hypothetical protein